MTIPTSFVTVLLYVYAAVLVFGGVFGYVKAQSLPSLIAGGASAVLIVAAALLLPHHPRAGLGLSVLVAITLQVFFIRRFRETRKPMPALPVIVCSAIVFVVAVAKFLTAMQAHHA